VILQLIALAGEHERRLSGQLGGDGGDLRGVGPIRLLSRRQVAPGVEIRGWRRGSGHDPKARPLRI
jgi:hypothetical protein